MEEEIRIGDMELEAVQAQMPAERESKYVGLFRRVAEMEPGETIRIPVPDKRTATNIRSAVMQLSGSATTPQRMVYRLDAEMRVSTRIVEEEGWVIYVGVRKEE